MNYQDQQRERRKRRAVPDDDDAALTRLWFQYLHSEGVAGEHIDDPNVRYWRHLDAERGD